MTDTVHNLPRLLRTLRYLKPVQVWGRVWMRVYRPRVDARPAPSPRAATGAWRGCARAPSMLGPVTFRFLNVEHTLARAADWNRADWPRLWLYNLHYFDDLVAADDPEFALAGAVGPSGPPTESLCRRAGRPDRSAWQRDLITHWITDNPPTHGAGWEPYPTSLRIVNWIKWTLAGNALAADALQSLAIQTRWLRKRLEFHLLGNHLWANAKALVFAGVVFDGEEAGRWFRNGIALVQRELAEQFLPDGGHFERSPMYHAIVLEDLLDLVQLAALYPARFNAVEVDRWRQTAARMLRWLRVMTHPDGDIALFNDAAHGIAPELAALADYAARCDVAVDTAPLRPLEALPDSGYVRMQAGDAVLIADVGEIGPDYLPGHAHADTLSFELSIAGKRVLVNGGTSTYENDAERLRQRGTAAHNTVLVDDQNSSEVWSAFRVGRRAHPLGVEYGEGGDGLWLRAAHDGYAHLPGRPIHHREWCLTASGLKVSDSIEGRFGHAAARFRFAPEWRVEAAAGGIDSAEPGRAFRASYRNASTASPVGAPEGATDAASTETASNPGESGRAFRPSYKGAISPRGAPEGATDAASTETASNPGESGRPFRASCKGGNNAPTLHVHTQPVAHIVDASYHPGFGVEQACRLVTLPVGPEGAVFTLAWRR